MSLKPELLAPAGDMESFLAALAAGADAVYLGLKHFSARMQAKNFSVKEFQQMTDLAHDHGRKVYLAFNTLLKPDEIDKSGRLLKRTLNDTPPDAMIIQDLGAINLLKQIGYKGQIHLSTLAAASPGRGLEIAAAAGVKRVILPRELSLDEIKTMAAACPSGLELEMFVHGALCYCVSGRCLWSSFMGGKSGLRGRCVQPCRRVYHGKNASGRLFSCLDLGLDLLTHTLLDLPKLVCWKIEGRKKSPRYVYHTVSAYRMLRDLPNDRQAAKEALELLGQSLGRRSTQFFFLPQRSYNPTKHGGDTDSGLLIGRTSAEKSGPAVFKPNRPLLPGDLLRIGCEGEPWHMLIKITSPLSKSGIYAVKAQEGVKKPKNGTPIFLIDRREKHLEKILQEWGKLLAGMPEHPSRPAPKVNITLPGPGKREFNNRLMTLRPRLPSGKESKSGGTPALWLAPKSLASLSRTMFRRVCWWLPPIIWPDEEDSWQRLISAAIRGGSREFVLNSPWQAAFFKGADQIYAIAGPFCNIANGLHLDLLRQLGFRAAIASPELAGEDFLTLPRQSPLTLGIITKGLWPLGVSRIRPALSKDNIPLQSPKSEVHYARRYGQNTWIYPNRPLDISLYEDELAAAGYSMFIHVEESLPRMVPEADGLSRFNWDLTLL